MSNRKKPTQRDTNIFPYTDSNKRYYTYDYYLRRTFGGKCAKIPIDGGFTCPNIDGRCGVGGCIYCSSRGSGDFAERAELSVSEQYRITREKLSSKWSVERCIPYFQAHTNTYAPLDILKAKFEEALSEEGVVGLNIATRADCLEDDVVEYLAELSERTVLTVELGLQTSNDRVAGLINRGHSFADFVTGYRRLKAASERINICVHIIFGLPEEGREDMLRTVRDVAELHPDQVKIHLLHVLRSSRLGEIYLNGGYTPMTKEDYVERVVEALELLPEDTVIARLTGDGMSEDLLAPDWSRKKVSVINDIDKLLYSKESYQGKFYKNSNKG
ncbi:MAG: TIGR01212 family radical SAM protein [Ruminococcaceae bacterium]|nr:TIGR01212 family radical SAM protein [Oscillospiraceae bacterium]